MKKHSRWMILIFSAIGFLYANDPGDEVIIKQPAGMEILYAVNASQPDGAALDIASLFEVSQKTILEEGTTLEPGLFIQEGEWIQEGILAYTGIEPIILFVKAETGINAITVFPGEKLAIGIASLGDGLYCDYCRCTCISDEGTNRLIDIGIVAIGQSTKAYFPWVNKADCSAREGDACETRGGFEGTLSGCAKISRKCL